MEFNLEIITTMKKSKKFDKALEDLKNGKAIIVVDDFDRENEGDLVMCAEKVKKETLVFGMLHARGLMCLPCEGSILDRLEIPIMVAKTTDPLETPFTVSVDGITTGTGMSVDDRIKTINIMLNSDSKPADLKRPGHLFPLRARKGLLKERKGHTEASIELMKIIGARQTAVIIEIMKEDGHMARLPDLEMFAKKHDLCIVSIEEIEKYVYDL